MPGRLKLALWPLQQQLVWPDDPCGAVGGSTLRTIITTGMQEQIVAWLCRFKLHSVLVHSGGMHGGHYYSYSRAQDNRWLKFDDDKASAPCCWGSGCHQRLCARPLACPTPVTPL